MNAPAQLLLDYPAQRMRTPPFLKWAGGKSQLLPEIRSRMPSKYARYFEPFLGGGAVFFDLSPDVAVLSDANEELINCYMVVRESADELLRQIRRWRVSEVEFYRLRALNPEDLTRVERAARFVFLNKTCFNGLYRVNKKGQFNVPYGKNKNCSIVNPDNLRQASIALQNAEILNADYLRILKERVRPNDFVYLDPPYFPISKYSDFKRYTKDFFYKEDHVRLAKTCSELDKMKCFFMVSNSLHPDIVDLYSKFRVEPVMASRAINCKGTGRGKITELIIRNY